VAAVGPVIEQLEGAEPLRPHKGLGSEDRDTKISLLVLAAKPFGPYLGLAIRTHTLQPVLLDDRMMIGMPYTAVDEM